MSIHVKVVLQALPTDILDHSPIFLNTQYKQWRYGTTKALATTYVVARQHKWTEYQTEKVSPQVLYITDLQQPHIRLINKEDILGKALSTRNISHYHRP